MNNQKWSRVILRQSACQIINELHPHKLNTLEISGRYYSKMKFRRYRSIMYPNYDVCEAPLPDEFDLIIAEQVFEHLLWPFRAGKNVFQMLSTGGYFFISTPFLVRVHPCPNDCTRWTETGLKYFLAECGFTLEKIRTFSWGNRACIMSNFSEWTDYKREIHPLINEPNFPYHVWALAQKI
jgi:Methyltransferase domain